MLAEVKWIKLATGLPDNRKIKQIRKLPQGDTIALMWVFLMCLAGETNDDGMVYFMPEIPYTDEMLADQFDIDVNTVRLGLATFQRFGMVEIVDDIICLASWEKWQAVDKLTEMREKTRQRVARHREKQRLSAGSAGGNVTCNVTVTQGNAVDKDIELDLEEDKKEEGDMTVSKDTVRSTDVQRVLDAWNALGLNKIKDINPGTNRHKQFKKRVKDYGIDAIIEAIEQIKNSSFLKGGGKKGFIITFDWFIAPNNFVKVREGNYTDRQEGVSNDGRNQNGFGGRTPENTAAGRVGQWY